ARLRQETGPFRVLPLHTFLPANSATELGLDDLRGYDALEPKAFLSAREEIGRFTSAPAVVDVVEPWQLAFGGAALEQWNVASLLLHPQFSFSAATLNDRLSLNLAEVYSGPDGRILRNRSVLPRARWARAGGEAKVVSFHPTRWKIDASSSGGGRLVVANATYPGWVARIDSRPAAIVSPEGRPIEIDVPKGRHVVELIYRPASFWIGVAVSALGLLALALTAARLHPA